MYNIIYYSYTKKNKNKKKQKLMTLIVTKMVEK